MARQGGERGRVKRVLGDGDEYAVSRAETDVEELTDPGRGSGGEEDVFGVARESITTCRRAVHGRCVSVLHKSGTLQGLARQTTHVR